MLEHASISMDGPSWVESFLSFFTRPKPIEVDNIAYMPGCYDVDIVEDWAEEYLEYGGEG